MSDDQFLDDYELIRRVSAGDHPAFRMLYDKYYALFFSYAKGLVNDEPTAEDLVHQVFMKVLGGINADQIHTSVAAYLKTMVRNAAINYIVKNKRHVLNEPDDWPESTTSQEDMELEMEKNHLIEELHKAIAKLPEKCRIVFWLSKFEKMSHQEISDELKISKKTIENQITKAMKMLKEMLAKYKGLSSIVILCINMLWGK